jgi:hypothetical protein
VAADVSPDTSIHPNMRLDAAALEGMLSCTVMTITTT